MSFSWIVEGQVAAMSMPWPEDLAELPSIGVRGLLSLTERAPAAGALRDLAHRHVPVRDFTAPTFAQLADSISFMDEVIAAGGAVAVHCGAGLGRTGTVVAAWLVHKGWTPAEAIREVRRKRPGSIETREQEGAVREFAAKAQGGKS